MSEARSNGSVVRRVLRWGLMLVATPVVVISAWGVLEPRGWYSGLGWAKAWVPPHGPFNEHLVVDFHLSQLALAVVLLAAAWRLSRGLIRLALVAWLVFAGPHFVIHWYHVGVASAPDRPLELASLGLQVLIPLLLLGLTGRDGSRTEEDPGRAADPVDSGSSFRRINPASGFWPGLLSWMTERQYGEPFESIRIAGHHGGVLFGSSMYEAAVDGFDALEERLQELISLRAAQMIGCPF